MLQISKFSLIITTRCNLRCRLCCEYVPQNKPFPDMTLPEERVILDALFKTVDHVTTLHLTGGGEPFLHKDLADMVRCAMDYADKFDHLMLFTNCTIPISQPLFSTLQKFRDKIVIQVSRYGINPESEIEIIKKLKETGTSLKIENYYGEQQSFGGWVDFGSWEIHSRDNKELGAIFRTCAITSKMNGNWRTRDGKAHWCTRSQRGMELGFIPDDPNDYVDLLDQSSWMEKREKFRLISAKHCLSACDYCSGDQGTGDSKKRYSAAEQM